ncbi:PF07119 family protein [Leptospira kirschneri serovar Grippotyphosa str. Moskva]|nr:PF07119 family protein [Leptospira kirschneri serovar Grippotyphosa str. Moskva]
MLEEAKILPTPVWSMARYADKTISPELSKNPSVWNPPLWIYPGTRRYWITGIDQNFPFSVIDFTLSFLADTILLPITIPLTVYYYWKVPEVGVRPSDRKYPEQRSIRGSPMHRDWRGCKFHIHWSTSIVFCY